MSDVKVAIKFKNTELILSAEEAKELHSILDRWLFGVKASSEVDKFPLEELKRLLEKEMPKIVPIPQPYPVPYPVYSSTRPYWEITWSGDGIEVRDKCAPVNVKTDQVAE